MPPDPRLQRLMMALQQQGLDPAVVMRSIPSLASSVLADPTEGQPEIGRQLVALRRQLHPPAFIGGPSPDPGWDRFFGALQVEELRASSNGQRLRTDLVGQPGDPDNSGIGFPKSRRI